MNRGNRTQTTELQNRVFEFGTQFQAFLERHDGLVVASQAQQEHAFVTQCLRQAEQVTLLPRQPDGVLADLQSEVPIASQQGVGLRVQVLNAVGPFRSDGHGCAARLCKGEGKWLEPEARPDQPRSRFNFLICTI